MPWFTPDPTPTSSPPTPMTTPFAVPSSCTGSVDFTTTLRANRADVDEVYLVDVGPDADACNHGQASNVTGRDLALAFSPGVCPSAWTAYNLAAFQSEIGKARRSSAWCCPSGFTPITVNLETAGCAQTVSQTVTSLQNATSSQGATHDGLRLTTTHRVTQRLATPWVVTWDNSDTRTMTPRPPSLNSACTGAEIAAWVPGAKVGDEDRHCQQEDHDLGWLGSPGFWGLVIGLPVAVVVPPSVWLCCLRPVLKKKRRERRNQEQAAAAARAVAAELHGTEFIVQRGG